MMNNNKKIIILLVFIIALLSFTTFFSFSRFTSQKVITDTIRTRELKIVFETNGNNTPAKSHSSVVNIIDTHSDNIIDTKYVWSITNNTNAVTGTSFTNGDEISTDGLSGIYYLCVYALDDKGFYNNTCSNAFFFDNTAPTIIVTLDADNNVYKKSHNAIINVVNDSYGAELDLDSFKYVWTKNIYVEPNEVFTNGDTVTKSDGTGSYYVMVTACDVLGNCNDYQSNASKLDNTVPNADIRVEVINGERYAVLDTYDEHSGVDNVESADGITAETKEKNLKIYVSTFNGLGSWGATDYNDYAQILSDAGYTDVTVVDPADGLPTLEYLQNNGYNTLIFNRAVWSTNQALMNQVFAAGINLFSSGDDSDSGLDIIKDYSNISTIDSRGDLVANDTIFTNRVGTINGHSDVGTYIHFIDGAETFYTRVVNGTTYGVGGCYTNNNTRWFHFQEAIGLYDDADSKLITTAVDYMANKGLVYFKIPNDATYTFNIYDKAGNELQKTFAIQGYSVEYYQGNGNATEGASILPHTSSFDNNVSYNLATYSAIGGTAPSGWIFAGWTTNPTSTNIEYQDGQSVTNLAPAGGTARLYAVFMRTVNIYSGLNKATTSSVVQYYNPYKNTYYTTINVPAPSTTNLSGWTARGYRSDTTAADRTYAVTTSAANISLPPTASNKLYAVYSRTLTFAYGGNNNTGGSTSNQTATQYYTSYNTKSTATVTAKSNGYTRTGYTFTTWNTKANGSGTEVAVGSNISFSPAVDSTSLTKTVYAQWAGISYTVKFNGNNNTGGSTANQGFTYGTAQNLRANGFTRTGYTFAGWNTKANGSGTSYSNQQSVNNLTSTSGGTFNLYAQWTANTYTVKFNGNGATSGSTANQGFTYGTAQNLRANGFARVGFSFAGWNTKADGSGTSYSNQQSVNNLVSTNGGSITLYAKWTPVSFKVVEDGVLKQSGVIVISSSSARRQEQNATCSTTSITAFESIRPSEQGYAYGTKRFYGTMAVGHHANGWESDCYPYYDITITFNSAYNGRTATFELYAMHTARFFRGNAQFYVNGTLKKETGENGWDTYFSGYNAAMEASYSSTVTINSNASLRLRVAAKTGSNDQWAPIVWGGIRNLTISA